jgi:hypothetical protein
MTTNNPGAYSLLLMVGPRALALMFEGEGTDGGPFSDHAASIADKLIDGATDAERRAMIRAAVDLFARYAVDDLAATDDIQREKFIRGFM